MFVKHTAASFRWTLYHLWLFSLTARCGLGTVFIGVEKKTWPISHFLRLSWSTTIMASHTYYTPPLEGFWTKPHISLLEAPLCDIHLFAVTTVLMMGSLKVQRIFLAIKLKIASSLNVPKLANLQYSHKFLTYFSTKVCHKLACVTSTKSYSTFTTTSHYREHSAIVQPNTNFATVHSRVTVGGCYVGGVQVHISMSVCSHCCTQNAVYQHFVYLYDITAGLHEAFWGEQTSLWHQLTTPHKKHTNAENFIS